MWLDGISPICRRNSGSRHRRSANLSDSSGHTLPDWSLLACLVRHQLESVSLSFKMCFQDSLKTYFILVPDYIPKSIISQDHALSVASFSFLNLEGSHCNCVNVLWYPPHLIYWIKEISKLIFCQPRPPDFKDSTHDIKLGFFGGLISLSMTQQRWYQTLDSFVGIISIPGTWPGDAEPYWRQVASLPRWRWCPPHPPTPTPPFSPKTHPASPFSWDPVHLPHYSVYWIPCSLLFILYIRSNLTLSSESGIQPYKNWNVSLQSNEEISLRRMKERLVAA